MPLRYRGGSCRRAARYRLHLLRRRGAERAAHRSEAERVRTKLCLLRLWRREERRYKYCALVGFPCTTRRGEMRGQSESGERRDSPLVFLGIDDVAFALSESHVHGHHSLEGSYGDAKARAYP